MFELTLNCETQRIADILIRKGISVIDSEIAGKILHDKYANELINAKLLHVKKIINVSETVLENEVKTVFRRGRKKNV